MLKRLILGSAPKVNKFKPAPCYQGVGTLPKGLVMFDYTPMQLAALAVLRLSDKVSWPPKYPRVGTLLTGDYGDTNLPHEQWGSDEWKAYALFLEETGAAIARRLSNAQTELFQARRKLSRRKAASPGMSIPTLLSSGIGDLRSQQKKRGRKESENREKMAREVIAIRQEIEATGKKITDKAALAVWYERNGMRSSRANTDRTTLNAVSKLRRNHNISSI